MQTDKLLYGFSEAQQMTGVSHWTLRRLAKEGLLPTINISSRVLIPRQELERIVREGTGKRRQRRTPE